MVSAKIAPPSHRRGRQRRIQLLDSVRGAVQRCRWLRAAVRLARCSDHERRGAMVPSPTDSALPHTVFSFRSRMIDLKAQITGRAGARTFEPVGLGKPRLFRRERDDAAPYPQLGERRPSTRNWANWVAISLELRSPSGLYHRGIQFTAPRTRTTATGARHAGQTPPSPHPAG